MLYEYKGNNPVKNADSAYYVVIFDSAQVKNSDLNGHNNSDRVVLDKKSSDVFFSALLKGNVEVYMVGDRGGIDSKYKFTVPGGDAFQHLSEKIHKKP